MIYGTKHSHQYNTILFQVAGYSSSSINVSVEHYCWNLEIASKSSSFLVFAIFVGALHCSCVPPFTSLNIFLQANIMLVDPPAQSQRIYGTLCTLPKAKIQIANTTWSANTARQHDAGRVRAMQGNFTGVPTTTAAASSSKCSNNRLQIFAKCMVGKVLDCRL